MNENENTQSCIELLLDKFKDVLEIDLIKEICLAGKLKEFDRGETLIEVGDLVDRMPLVLSGAIKILTEDKESNELLLYYLELGDTCAMTLNCCTSKSKSAIKAITEEKSEILFVPVHLMDVWMVQYKSWRAFVLNSYNERLNELVDALDHIVFNSMEQRIIKYLKDKVLITKSTKLNVSHQEIANDLHSSRVVISRMIKKLEQSGYLKQARSQIEILDLSKFNSVEAI